MLLGVGGSVLFMGITTGKGISFPMDAKLNNLYYGILFSLLSTLIIVTLRGFNVTPLLGKFLILEYSVIALIILLF